MPCGDKWKNKTMRRFPLGRQSAGVGRLYGNLVGTRSYDSSSNVNYQPGCPPIVQRGVSLNYVKMQSGYYVPDTITGAIPVWEPKGSCCESCAQGGECEGGCGDACTCGKEGPGYTRKRAPGSRRKSMVSNRGMGRRSASRPKPLVKRGVGSCAGGIDPSMGRNRVLSGGATNTRSAGLYYGFQRRRDPQRTAPYPVGQQPYFVGRPINALIEPYAGCPTRSVPYWYEGNPGGGIGRSLTHVPSQRLAGRLTRLPRRQLTLAR